MISHITTGRVRPALDQVADAFATQERTDPGTQEHGWGQFLNVPPNHIQIGSYGTAAALLALGLANRIDSFSPQNITFLTGKWATGTVAPKRSSQTLRLAFIHLALRVVRIRNNNTLPPILERLYANLRTELLNRCINQNAWGDWWINDIHHDRTPSVFATSMIILSFAVMEPDLRSVPDQIIHAVRELEDRQRGGQHSSQQSAAALAAIMAFNRKDTAKRFRLELRKLCAIWEDDRTYPLIHFYDFEYLDQNKITKYDRDYFIVPRGILIGVAALYASEADWRLRLEANRILEVFTHNINQNAGVYKAQSDQYAATKDQAWVILLLSLSLDYPHSISLRHKLLAKLVGPKPETWFWNVYLPVALIIALEGIAVLIGPAGKWGAALAAFGVPELAEHILSAVSATLGGVVLHHSAGRIARKLLPGY